jgi:hypothetical protein
MLKWGPVDKKLRKFSGIATTKPEFYTPFGRFTYEQLLSMPMDKVLQMLIVLELVENKKGGVSGWGGSDPAWEKEFLDKGMLPPGADPKEFTLDMFTGKYTRTSLRPTKNSRLNPDQKATQERFFRLNKLETCPIRRPHRCYSEAYSMPGLCVSDTKKCFDKNYYKQYKDDYLSKYAFLDNNKDILPKTLKGENYSSERELLLEQNEILRNMLLATPGARNPSSYGLKPNQNIVDAQKKAAQNAVQAATDKLSNARALAARYP